MPFKATAGLHHAVRNTDPAHGIRAARFPQRTARNAARARRRRRRTRSPLRSPSVTAPRSRPRLARTWPRTEPREVRAAIPLLRHVQHHRTARGTRVHSASCRLPTPRPRRNTRMTVIESPPTRSSDSTTCRTASSRTADTEPRVGVGVGDSRSRPRSRLGRRTSSPSRRSTRSWRRAGPGGTRSVPQITGLRCTGDIADDAVFSVDDVTLHLPIEVADYVDFYASENHATNLGRLFRPEPRPADAQLEAPAGRVPRAVEHRRRLRHRHRPPVRSAQGPERRGPRLRPVGPPRHRGGDGLRRRCRSHAGRRRSPRTSSPSTSSAR